MARKALINKAKRQSRFSARVYSRCPVCGRARAFMRKFGVCRICFRNLALNGQLPGVVKSSW